MRPRTIPVIDKGQRAWQRPCHLSAWAQCQTLFQKNCQKAQFRPEDLQVSFNSNVASPNLPPPSPLPPRTSRSALALPGIRNIGLAQPLNWLLRGAQDMRRGGWLSLLHGLAPAAFGGLLVLLARDRFWLLAGAFSGFLVVAPVLATSLYAMSRAIERGEPVNLRLIANTWTRWQYSRYAARGGYWSLVRFGLLLALAGTGWVLTSAALITLLAPQPVNTPLDFLRHVVLAPGHYVFELWLTLGGLLAAPIFASSVIAMPLLLAGRAGQPGSAGLMGDAHRGADAGRPGRGAAAARPCQLARLPRPGRCQYAARTPAAAGCRLMFGYSEEQVAAFGLSFGVGAFMLYMMFIIGQLAWSSKAGKFGTFVIFLGLAFGMVGFVAKYFIQWMLEK